MKKSHLKKAFPFVLAAAMLVVWQMSPLAAGEKSAAAGSEKTAKAAAAGAASASAMSEYLVISPHTAEQCLQALDATMDMPGAKNELAKWEWGCMSGDHTGYLMVRAASADDALKHVPESFRSQARAVKLNKFTAAEIKAAHEAKK